MSDESQEFHVVLDGSAFDLANKLMAKHAEKIGHAVVAWNRLHDQLGIAFADIVNPDYQHIGLTVWHAISSDRGQRDVLSAAIDAALPDDDRFGIDLRWIINKTSNQSGHRNKYIHAAFTTLLEDGALKLIPDHFTGNKKAEKLANTDLSRDLAILTQDLSILDVFLGQIRAFRNTSKDGPWPKRPTLLRPDNQGNPEKT